MSIKRSSSNELQNAPRSRRSSTDSCKWLHIQIPEFLHTELHHQARLNRLSLREFVTSVLQMGLPRSNCSHDDKVGIHKNETIELESKNK